MRFVSKYARFGFNVRGGSMRWVRDSSGNERQISNGDDIYLTFKPGLLRAEEHETAVELFTNVNPLHPFGASPKMHDDVISAQEALAEGEAHNAHDGFMPFQRIGVFDTDDPQQCPGAWKEAAEEGLLKASEFGVDLFRIDNYGLKAPWPSYPTEANASAAGIINFAKQAGFDLEKVLRYEQATTQRKGLTAALETAIAEQQAERSEEQALAIK